MTARSLPRADHRQRRERLRSRLTDLDVDVLLVTSPVDVRWATGFSGSNGQLHLAPDASADRLITDERYDERAEVEAAGLPRRLSRDPVAVLLEELTGADGVRVGFQADHLTYAAARDLERRVTSAGHAPVPVSDAVTVLRAVKDDAEVATLTEACRITTSALAWLLEEAVAVGRTERQLAVALERRLVDLGADAPAFPSIVATGPHSAIPHHEPTDRPVTTGDLLKVDCGARLGGYHADCTRTVAVGHLDDDLHAVHEVVRQAQQVGRDAAQAGVAAKDVDAAARRVIEESGFGEQFVHGTGHGVGLQVHEAPAVSATSGATLAAGMALTVEPGIYLPGRGGVRIEDTVIVTADGPPTCLTDLPRELRVL